MALSEGTLLPFVSSLPHTHLRTQAPLLSYFRPSGWKVKKTNLKRQFHSEKPTEACKPKRKRKKETEEIEKHKTQSTGRDAGRERGKQTGQEGALTRYLKKL